MMVKIATWNVNSIKARLPNVLAWLKDAQPDVALLQEIKCVAEQFPEMEIGDLGYNVAAVGQKTYNGVAILSKSRIEVEQRVLPGGDGGEEQARYIEALIDATPTPFRVASIYLPNGNPIGTEKFAYKLAWMDRLRAHAEELLKGEEVFVLGGDYNVIPWDIDARNPAAWVNDALAQPESRNHFRALLYLGLTDAFRALHPEGGHYSFWDYQGGAWPRDDGIRIDHLLLSPQAADRLMAAGIDRGPRGKDKASDHTPVWCELKL
ncbi:MAG: exodeoxyribonuclease III [Alphaproteobacteria bacterium]